MKYIYFGLILIFTAWNFSFWSSTETRQEIEVHRYKRAAESAADSACRAISYWDETTLKRIGNGFGEGLQSPLNISIDRNKAVLNFENIFFGNLSIVNEESKKLMRKRIVLSALIEFDGISIKTGGGDWQEKVPFLMEWQGEKYSVNFSDKLLRIKDNKWVSTSEVPGYSEKAKKCWLSSVISEKINDELLKAGVAEGTELGRYLSFYSDVTGESDTLTSFSGPGFLAIIDGIEIPGMNIPGRNKIKIYSVGGSDIHN